MLMATPNSSTSFRAARSTGRAPKTLKVGLALAHHAGKLRVTRHERPLENEHERRNQGQPVFDHERLRCSRGRGYRVAVQEPDPARSERIGVFRRSDAGWACNSDPPVAAARHFSHADYTSEISREAGNALDGDGGIVSHGPPPRKRR